MILNDNQAQCVSQIYQEKENPDFRSYNGALMVTSWRPWKHQVIQESPVFCCWLIMRSFRWETAPQSRLIHPTIQKLSADVADVGSLSTALLSFIFPLSICLLWILKGVCRPPTRVPSITDVSAEWSHPSSGRLESNVGGGKTLGVLCKCQRERL